MVTVADVPDDDGTRLVDMDVDVLRYLRLKGVRAPRVGRAGWVSACDRCREQVAFFLDRCN